MTLNTDPISSFPEKPQNPQSGSTKRRIWTVSQRAAAADRARRVKPWLRATGPKTAEGKARCAKNALKHGYYSIAARTQRAVNRAHRAFVGHANALLRLEKYLVKRFGLPYNPAIKDCGRFSGLSKVHAFEPYHSPRSTVILSEAKNLEP